MWADGWAASEAPVSPLACPVCCPHWPAACYPSTRRSPRPPPGLPTLAGLIVIDVVEGTALASLPHMSAVLARRPPRFPSLAAAVTWALDSGMSKSPAAAAVSLPAMLRRAVGLGGGGRGDGQQQLPSSSWGAASGGPAAAAAASGPLGVIAEEGAEEEEDDDDEGDAATATAAATPPAAAGGAVAEAAAPPDKGSSSGCGGKEGIWIWRTRLEDSQPAWEGWYRGLSDLFLAVPVPKVGARGQGQALRGESYLHCTYGLDMACRQSTGGLVIWQCCRLQIGWMCTERPQRKNSKPLPPNTHTHTHTHARTQVLVLAGTDRLDKPLTIGQMQVRRLAATRLCIPAWHAGLASAPAPKRSLSSLSSARARLPCPASPPTHPPTHPCGCQGKFQLVLLPAAGHAVQEDEPHATAQAVAAFLRRFCVGEPPMALPRAAPGLPPVLPVVAGPSLSQQRAWGAAAQKQQQQQQQE